MDQYKNLAGNSGVAEYEIGEDFIKVLFEDGGIYVYTRASAGQQHIENMKRLAIRGRGVCTHISQHVHNAYEVKNG